MTHTITEENAKIFYDTFWLNRQEFHTIYDAHKKEGVEESKTFDLFVQAGWLKTWDDDYYDPGGIAYHKIYELTKKGWKVWSAYEKAKTTFEKSIEKLLKEFANAS